MKQRGKKILGIVILVVVVAAMALLYAKFREKPVEGSKNITIEVVNSENESEVYELKTDAQFLEQAMDELEEQGLTYEASEGPYGLSVSKVNGERAVYEMDSAYWAFYVNGEYCSYGISQQPVEDGDAFEIVYEKAQ